MANRRVRGEPTHKSASFHIYHPWYNKHSNTQLALAHKRMCWHRSTLPLKRVVPGAHSSGLHKALTHTRIFHTMGSNSPLTAYRRNAFLPVAEDKKILKHTASLSQNIQQHVTNFYRTDTTTHPHHNPFGFEPTTAKGLEIALRRFIAFWIVGFINDTIKRGEQNNLDNYESQF